MATLPKEGTFVFRYVFVDGIDTTESDPLRKLLVVDPSDGESKTLYEAMVDRYAFEKDDNGRPLTPSTTQLNSNFKCVFLLRISLIGIIFSLLGDLYEDNIYFHFIIRGIIFCVHNEFRRNAY